MSTTLIKSSSKCCQVEYEPEAVCMWCVKWNRCLYKFILHRIIMINMKKLSCLSSKVIFCRLICWWVKFVLFFTPLQFSLDHSWGNLWHVLFRNYSEVLINGVRPEVNSVQRPIVLTAQALIRLQTAGDTRVVIAVIFLWSLLKICHLGHVHSWCIVI